MSSPHLTLYPPVETPPAPTDFTWDALIRLSHTDPVVRLAVGAAERGDLTREQALVWIAYTLYSQKAQLFATLVEQKATEIPDFVLVDGKRYDRCSPEEP